MLSRFVRVGMFPTTLQILEWKLDCWPTPTAVGAGSYASNPITGVPRHRLFYKTSRLVTSRTVACTSGANDSLLIADRAFHCSGNLISLLL